MKSLHLLFNHRLTPEQEADAKASLGVERFVYLPEALQKLWSQVPASDVNLIIYLEPIKIWIESAKSDDYVLIQGDYGAAFHLINYCIEGNYGIPVYSTTERQTQEIKLPDGEFRRYE
jgi:hypothetical protein